MSEFIDYSMLPKHMQGAMKRYIKHGIRPGDFLYLILCNDFVHALGQADIINMQRIADYAKFLYWELPMTAWGSREKVDDWIKSHQKKEADDE
jgi:hypothetical protein